MQLQIISLLTHLLSHFLSRPDEIMFCTDFISVGATGQQKGHCGQHAEHNIKFNKNETSFISAAFFFLQTSSCTAIHGQFQLRPAETCPCFQTVPRGKLHQKQTIQKPKEKSSQKLLCAAYFSNIMLGTYLYIRKTFRQ